MYSRIGPSNPWVQVTSPGWLEACQSERCPHDRIHLSRSIELRFRFKSDTSVKLRFFKHVSLWYCQLRVVVSSQPLMWPLPKISKCEVQVLPATSSSLPLDEEIPAVSYPKFAMNMISCRHLWKKWTFNATDASTNYQDDKMDWISRLLSTQNVFIDPDLPGGKRNFAQDWKAPNRDFL